MKGFHAGNNLTFERLPDGAVKVRLYFPVSDEIHFEATLPPNTWCSVVAATSRRGDTAEAFWEAKRYLEKP